jgi:hypothetical protein
MAPQSSFNIPGGAEQHAQGATQALLAAIVRKPASPATRPSAAQQDDEAADLDFLRRLREAGL